METRAAVEASGGRHSRFSKKLYTLTIAGGVVFWAATIAISLLPIAADYRAAGSGYSIRTVWVDSLLVGMIVGCLVSYSLLRFFDKIPTKNPILKSEIMSFIALVIALLLIEVPASFRTSDALYYFLIGAMLNVPRFLLLGLVTGYLYKRSYG
jgi:NhaP-type Na+/H+ or K+/H+ antiporter